MPERGVARPSGMSQSSGLPWYRRRTPLIVAFVAIVVALGALQCRAWNGTPNADGISYLELAERYSKGDLGGVANGYWSPLYPALLGLAMRVAGASGIYYGGGLAPELRVALVVNLAVLALATFAFARLALALDDSEPETTPRAVRIARLILAASLWIWAAIRLVAATTITPDMLLAAWLMLATAELLAMTREPTTRATIVRLAIVLALGYWTKAVFFPLVLVGIVAAAALTRREDRRGTATRLALLALALCAPLVAVQSASQGHLTFGDTGRLNYQWYVGEVPRLAPRAETSAARPGDDTTASIVRTPMGPVLLTGNEPGSFPFWHDPSRFTERRPTAFSLGAQWRVLRANAHWYRVVAGTFAILCLCAAIAGAVRQRVRLERALVAAPVLTLLALHALTHPEGRLAGAALAVSMTLLVYLGGTPRTESARPFSLPRIVECAALVMAAVLALGRTSNRVSLAPRPTTPNLAADLARHGLRPGDQVGVLGAPFGHYWAREAGVRIVLAQDDRTTPTLAPADPELVTLASDACARGVPLDALLWRDESQSSAEGVLPLPDGWRMWRVRQPCDDEVRLAPIAGRPNPVLRR